MRAHERFERHRCSVCNHRTTEAWICMDCSLGYIAPRCEDWHGSSPTVVSRGRQRLVDAGAEYEQLIQLQTVTEPTVTPAERGNTEVERSRRIRGMSTLAAVGPGGWAPLNRALEAAYERLGWKPSLVSPKKSDRTSLRRGRQSNG